MIPIIFVYSHDNIFQGVKQESSHLAIRRNDNDGNQLFEKIVFDEAYLIKFRELFFDAQAEVTPALSAYMKDVPVGPHSLETQDFSTNRDYIIHLIMPRNYLQVMTKPVDIKIKQFLIAYIMYRWLETKLSDEAEMYLERAYKVLDDAKRMLDRRTDRQTIAHQLF